MDETLLVELGYDGIEHLVAQLQTLDDRYTTLIPGSHVTPGGDGGFKIVWGNILGDISNQADLKQAIDYLQEQIDEGGGGGSANVFVYKGSVNTYADLAEKEVDAKIGDCYNVIDTGANYAWDGSAWDKLGETIDLSDYLTKEELDNALAFYYLKSEIDELLNTLNAKVEADLALKADITALETVDGKVVSLDTKVDEYIADAEDEFAKKTDTYTKAESDNLLSAKANASETYTKAEIDDIIDDLPVADNVYTKEETNELLSAKADLSETYTQAQVDTLLTGKANASETYTKAEIDSMTSALFTYKGQVESYEDLPSSGQKTGDTYNVVDTGANYTWNGSAWDKLSETIDLTPYALNDDLDAEITNRTNTDEALQDAINGLADSKADKTDLDNYYDKDEIDAMTTALFKYKGQVETEADLPAEDNQIGDTWNVIETGANYTWNGSAWDRLSEIIDLTPYALKTDLSEVDARVTTLEGKDFVEYADLSTSTYPNRKGILLDENNGIYGKDSLERVKLISMIENDTVEFGAASLQTNINTSGNLLINSEGNVITDKNAGNFILAGDDVSIDVVVDANGIKTYTINAELGDVTTAIANEADARSDADGILQGNIDTVSGDLDALTLTVNTHISEAAETYATKAELSAETEARTNKDALIISKIWNQADMTKGYFYTKDQLASGSYALLFNEHDGGGSQVFDKTSNTKSYVGTNLEEGAGKQDGVNVQIYSLDDTSKEGVRLNVNTQKAYYLKGSSKQNVAEREIAVQGDISTAITALSETYYNKTEIDDLIQDMDVGQLRQDLDDEIQSRIDADDALDSRVSALETATQSIFHYKGNVNTVADLDNIENPAIGDVYNVVETGANYCYNGTNWDKLSETVDLSAYDLTADREAADAQIISKIWSNPNLNIGYFKTRANSDKGSALIFNETDGGGSKYEGSDGLWSYVGVNDGTAGKVSDTEGNVLTGREHEVMGQIYVYDSVNNGDDKVTAINMTKNGFYYKHGANTNVTTDDEIATIGAVNAVNADLETLDGKVDEVSERVDDALAHQDGSIQALLLQMEELQSKVEDLKSLDYEVVVIYDGGDTEFDNDEKSFQLSGAVTNYMTVNSENVTLNECSVFSTFVDLQAHEDVTVRNSYFTGNIQKTQTNAIMKVHADGYVSIRDCEIDTETAYNGIEIGLSTGLAKSVIIDNVNFIGHMSNNAINIFGMDDYGVVTISNCTFHDLSNVLRISNRTNTSWTINIINCVCESWETGQYAGMILLQDYTSGSADAADEANQFAKLTINIQNCTKPDGTKITMPENLADICSTQDDNQIIYMWDSWRNFTEYDANKFPEINIK